MLTLINSKLITVFLLLKGINGMKAESWFKDLFNILLFYVRRYVPINTVRLDIKVSYEHKKSVGTACRLSH